MLRIFRLFSGIGLAAVLVGLAIGVYAYTNTNTVSSSNSGDGNNAISGYTITAPAYVLNSTDPTKIHQVTFTLSPALGGTEKMDVSLTGATPFQSCTATSGGSQTCTFAADVAVSSATNLRVIISQ